jgi:hypothetical protein
MADLSIGSATMIFAVLVTLRKHQQDSASSVCT